MKTTIYLATSTIANLRAKCERERAAEDPRDPSGADWDAIAGNLTDMALARDRGAERLEVTQATLDWLMDELSWFIDDDAAENN